MDYAVTNLGLNTKYHATKEKPFTIFYGDMDGSGKKRLIEAEFEGDKWYPVRGKSCSTLAMPSLQNKFPNFGSFAIATLEEIYPPSKLNESQRFDATHLQSGVFINDGRGHFDFNPFPRLAQITASYGIAFNDMDGDGFQDLLLSQNSYAPQLETGHFDAGQGIMLSGLGNGQFEAVWPKQSGFSFPGDAKSLTFIDWNADAKPDVLISRNNDTLLAFENQPNDGAKSITLILEGSQRNPQAIGTRIVAILNDQSSLTQEIYAGASYLSQSSPRIHINIPMDKMLKEIQIHWSDSTQSKHAISTNGDSFIRLKKPKKR